MDAGPALTDDDLIVANYICKDSMANRSHSEVPGGYEFGGNPVQTCTASAAGCLSFFPTDGLEGDNDSPGFLITNPSPPPFSVHL